MLYRFLLEERAVPAKGDLELVPGLPFSAEQIRDKVERRSEPADLYH